MAEEKGASSWHSSLLDEDAQHFEFASFYKEPEFCDRSIRLEILDESRIACGREVANKTFHFGGEVSMSGKKLRVLASPQDEEIPVNSIVLAAKSRVLRTMMSNGMRETDTSQPVILKVTSEEKLAFKEMLHFMYSGRLSTAVLNSDTTSVRTLVDLLVAGDKFEARSFMGAVLKALSKRKTTVLDTEELALRVPEILEQHPEIKGLVKKARDKLLETFKDADKWSESADFLALGQDALRFLLQSELLEADSEEKIFEGTIAWVLQNESTLEGRLELMTDLSRFLRFGCMRGEYLLESVYSHNLMNVLEVQERVMEGLYFQSYSDERKAAETDLNFQERQGVLDARSEILFSLKLQVNGSAVESHAATWLGREWTVKVLPSNQKPRTVGIYLTRKFSDADKSAATKITFCFYARTWPRGFWEKLGNQLSQDFSTVSDWGFSDALKTPWDEARTSKFVGPTGEVSLKVIMRRR